MNAFVRGIIKEILTKSGNEVMFVRNYDSEGGKNRGWICHKLSAMMNGKEVGYLKIVYIPSERFKIYYGHLFDYLRNIKGWCSLEGWRQKSLIDLCLDIATYVSINTANDIDRRKSSITAKELNGIYNSMLRLIRKKFNKEHEAFKLFHVNKPLVDYIRVYDQYARQGIGTMLYVEGTKWMNELGMDLYASGLQSDEAKAVWKAMAGKYSIKMVPYNVGTKRKEEMKNRFCLNLPSS